MSDLTRDEALEKLLKAHSHHYDIGPAVEAEGWHYPATATFYLRDESYVIVPKNVISAFEQYDYVYFYTTEHLDAPTAQKLLDDTLKIGMGRITPHKEHKSSYVTLVILADIIDEEAKKLIRKTRFQKNFRLALHGWMEYHITAMEISTNSFLCNPAGKGAKKTLELNFGSEVH